MIGRMIRPEIYGGVGSGRLMVNAYTKVGWVSGYGKVKEVDTVTRFEGDLSTTKNPTHLSIGIYRKPTTTDTTINFRSNLPLELRMAAYNFLIRRMLTLPLNAE